MAEAKEEKKEKDTNNKITGWDVVDTPQLLRKLPIGPSIEELQDSKVDQLLENKSRPTSHTLKDVLAFTLGNAIQEGIGAGIGAGVNKIKGKKAASKYIDNLLNTATDSAKKSRAMNLASRKSDDTVKGFIKDIESAYNTSSKATDALENAETVKNTLIRKLAEAKEEVIENTNRIKKNEKLLKNIGDVDFDAVKELDLDHTNIDELSSENRNLVEKAMSKFNTEEVNKSLKKSIRNNEKNIQNLTYHIDNFPTNEKLEKNAKEALDNIKSRKDMLSDYLNGMSLDDITKKYGTEKQTYTGHPYNKNAKTAGKKIFSLEKNDEMFLNWLAAFGDDPRAKNFLQEINNPGYEKLVDMFLMAEQDLFDTIKPGTPVDVIRENKDKILDAWDEVSSAWKKGIDARVALASGIENDGLKDSLVNKANEDLHNTFVHGGKQVFGNDIFGIKVNKEHTKKQILNDLKSNKAYIDKFNKLISPNDPLHKELQKIDGSNVYKAQLDPLLRKGMSIPEAIQDKALERVINYYDADFDKYINQIIDYDIPPSAIDKVSPKPDFSNSKLRNADGTLKSADELAEFLTKDPIYIDTINEYIKGLTNNANTFAKAGALKGMTLPILGRYAERSIKHGVDSSYDPFNKNTGFKLPPNMKPWDESTEFSTLDKLIDNAKSFFGVNFDQDPSRFSTKQIDDMRQALINANEEVQKWNPIEVEGWSDREVLRLIKEIGSGKRPDISAKVKAEYNKLKEEK